MRLVKDSLCFLIRTPHYIDHQLKSFDDLEPSVIDEFKWVYNEKREFYKEKGFRTLVFSDKSKENLKDYIVPKEIRFDVLRTLPNRKDIIMIDSSNCFQYIKTEDKLQIYYYTYILGLTHSFYISVDLKNENVKFDTLHYKSKGISEDYMDYYSKFLVTVTYLELTPVTLNVVEGGQKKGDIFRNNLIKNESKFNVIQVNSNWNTKCIRIGTFDVRGHYRLQPYGSIGNKVYKYIFIEPFKKNLFIRTEQKKLVS